MADNGKRCGAHEDLIKEVAIISANTQLIIQAVNRIEARVYDEHGIVAKTSGSISAALKVAGVAAAISAAVATAINIVAV